MLSISDIALLALGLLSLLMGYSLFREMLPLWGFLMGGWLAYTIAPGVVPADFLADLPAPKAVVQIASFFIGGIIGAVIARPLYFLMIFAAGAAMGLMIGVLIGAVLDVGGIASVQQISAVTDLSFPPVPQTPTQLILAVIIGLILGGLAISFQKFMICASTAFLGSAAIFTGLSGVIGGMTSGPAASGAVVLLGWLLLGMVGMFLQFRMMGEV